jgi:exodeoxyribonuclease V alpha subunit
VLGDICGSGRQDSYSTGFADFIKRVAADIIPADPVVIASPVLSDSLVVLKQNYRFGADSSIGKLSQAINSGDGMKAFTFLNDERSLNSCWQDVPGSDRLKKALEKKIISGYAPFLTAASPAEALKLFDRFRVLSAMRQGPYGVVGLNAIVEEILAENGLIKHNNRWYSGRPVMVTVNDYSMKLFNGDIGIVFPDPDYGGDPRVWFPAPEGGVRSVSPLRLPLHETVYAMTVHKSQGSEFENILMILPDHDSGTLARELIYTGITRAKNGVEVWADKNVFIAAVARRTDRKAGLADILWCDVKC